MKKKRTELYRKLKRLTLACGILLTNIAFFCDTAFAEEAAGGGLMNSKIYTGTLAMITDATSLLSGVSGVLGTLLFILFSWLATTAQEEQDKAKWRKNRKTGECKSVCV